MMRLLLLLLLVAPGCSGSDTSVGGGSPFVGSYAGSYSGNDFGSVTMTIDVGGNVGLTATSSLNGARYSGTGNLDAATGSMTGAGTCGAASCAIAGTFTPGPPARGSGTWSSSIGGSGNWSVQRE